MTSLIRPATDPDAVFFMQHPDRQCHIRDADTNEFRQEFALLGDHSVKRRRVLLWKPPEWERRVMKIPFLAFADETISDTDEVLLPILKEIMQQQAKVYGIPFGNG